VYDDFKILGTETQWQIFTITRISALVLEAVRQALQGDEATEQSGSIFSHCTPRPTACQAIELGALKPRSTCLPGPMDHRELSPGSGY